MEQYLRWPNGNSEPPEPEMTAEELSRDLNRLRNYPILKTPLELYLTQVRFAILQNGWDQNKAAIHLRVPSWQQDAKKLTAASQQRFG